MGIVRWSNPSTRRRCRRLSTPPAVFVQSHQQLPRQLAESQWRHDARVLGSPPLAPKLLREFLLTLVGFWVAAPLCRSVGFWVAAPSFVPPLPGGRRPLTHSPRREVVSGAGSHEGCPPHGFWASPNGGVVSAVIPCPHERWRC